MNFKIELGHFEIWDTSLGHFLGHFFGHFFGVIG